MERKQAEMRKRNAQISGGLLTEAVIHHSKKLGEFEAEHKVELAHWSEVQEYLNGNVLLPSEINSAISEYVGRPAYNEVEHNKLKSKNKIVKDRLQNEKKKYEKAVSDLKEMDGFNE